MKLIDEKGRLFGKINLIDLLVVILIVAVIAAVAWKLGGRKAAAAVTGSAKKAVYTVEIEDVPADIAAYAETQTGKSLVNDSKVIAASITDVRSETYNADNGHQTLFITVEADASFTGNVYKVGPQEVRVGYEYILKTSEFELTGLICALEVTDGGAADIEPSVAGAARHRRLVFGAGAFEQSSGLPGPHVALEPDARVVHPSAGER